MGSGRVDRRFSTGTVKFSCGWEAVAREQLGKPSSAEAQRRRKVIINPAFSSFIEIRLGKLRKPF